MSVRTVLGDVDPADLGITMAHEHLLMTGGWPVRNEPDYRLDSVDVAVDEIGLFSRLGGTTVVEMTPLGFGRDPDGLRRISRRSGVAIVACTGFHKMTYYASDHWCHRYPVETIADLLTAEIVEGIDRGGLDGPVVDRSAARAGVVKLSTEYHRAGVTVERLATAVGITHARTGAPISTHTDQGTMGHEQLDLLAANDVPETAVVLGHIDHNPDAGHLAELAGRGAFLGFDMPGRTKYGSDAAIIDIIATLVEQGHGDRVLLGGDLARRSYWTMLGGGPGYGYLLERFVPRLRARIGDAATDAILVANPATALALRALPR